MTTLAELASQNFQRQFSDPNRTLEVLKPYIKNGEISVNDLNSLFNTAVNFTGGGSQGSGLHNLEDLYFDADGNVLLNDGLLSGKDITETTSKLNFYKPSEDLSANGDYVTGLYKPPTAYSYNSLSEAQKQNIMNQGLFSNIQNVDFATQRQVPISDSSIKVEDLSNTFNSLIKNETTRLSNVSKKESDGYLLSPQGIGTLLGGIGSVAGIPFLTAASQAASTAQNLGSGNIGSALMSGVGLYNTSGGIANNANFNNTNPQAMGSPLYESFNPSQYLSQNILGIENPTVGRYVGNAGVSGAVAALDGNDVGQAVINSLARTGIGDLGNALGLPSMVTGMLQQGLPYLFNGNSNTMQTSTNTNTNTQAPSTNTNTQQPITSPYTQIPTIYPTYNYINQNPYSYIPPSYTTPPINYDLQESDDVDDESDTNNPYNTPINYGGSGRNVYG